jgi:hypothetical protein
MMSTARMGRRAVYRPVRSAAPGKIDREMASARTRDPLSADATERLVEFARACKAAIRIVAMYPASHPNIAAALSRMTGAGLGATANGPMLLTVGPDALLMDGRALAKPDPTVTELALLLREHHIGELTLNGPLTADGWHMLLSLLARSPEDVRLAGGIARAWHSAGGGAVEIREIDYGEVLRERTGSADGSWESLIASCLVGDAQTTRDKSTRAPLLHVAADAGRRKPSSSSCRSAHARPARAPTISVRRWSGSFRPWQCAPPSMRPATSTPS